MWKDLYRSARLHAVYIYFDDRRRRPYHRRLGKYEFAVADVSRRENSAIDVHS
jgi:hypothetical protein